MIAMSQSRPVEVEKARWDVGGNNGEECELFIGQV
jgi:hypothetical protein